MSDRRIHAWLPATGDEIVRYDRAGKWYLETPHGTRLRMNLLAAALRAFRWREFLGGKVYSGLPGGAAFDRAVDRMKR